MAVSRWHHQALRGNYRPSCSSPCNFWCPIYVHCKSFTLDQISNAIKALSSSGVANPEDSSTAQAEILNCHSEGPVLADFDLPDLSPAITVADYLVFKALKVFPKGSSLVAFNFGLNFFRMQCLVLQYQ